MFKGKTIYRKTRRIFRKISYFSMNEWQCLFLQDIFPFPTRHHKNIKVEGSRDKKRYFFFIYLFVVVVVDEFIHDIRCCVSLFVLIPEKKGKNR